MSGTLHVLFPDRNWEPDETTPEVPTQARTPPSSAAERNGSAQAARAILQSWLAYTEGRSDLGAGTLENYRRAVRHAAQWAEDTPFMDVDLHDYVRTRRSFGIADRTIELELRIVRMAFQWAKEERLLPTAAHLRFPKLRIDRKRFKINHRTPTAAEVGRVLAVMPQDDWRLALTIVARTGARIGEVASLRQRDVDHQGRRIALGSTEGDSKTGLRWFPLDNDSLAALSGRQGTPNESLFDFDGLADPKQALRRRLLAACRKADVAEFTPHGLRRMVVSRLMRAGVDVGTAASLTGHSVVVMLRLYQQVNDDDRRRGADLAALGKLA